MSWIGFKALILKFEIKGLKTQLKYSTNLISVPSNPINNHLHHILKQNVLKRLKDQNQLLIFL